MEKKRKLVAISHNYIGETLAKSLPNKSIELEQRVVIPISAEHLLAAQQPRAGRFENRDWMIQQVRDPEIAVQSPDLLLLYIGRSPMLDALNFATLFESAEIHLVLNRERDVELNFQESWDTRQWSYWPILHFAETTGNCTMARLVDQFINTGFIQPEPIWW